MEIMKNVAFTDLKNKSAEKIEKNKAQTCFNQEQHFFPPASEQFQPSSTLTESDGKVIFKSIRHQR